MTTIRALLISLALLVLAAGANSVLAAGQVIRTDHGAVRGTTIEGVRAFRGIPFAAPPVDLLRWRPPQPAPAGAACETRPSLAQSVRRNCALRRLIWCRVRTVSI
ncbi:MAG: carboxylesterase family protein [Proteobacteria bacterium]|nr:carboxylesterase family protein [Pseudomonadota bacterium]